MIRSGLNFILIACLVVGVYKAFGGDVSAFMLAAGDIVLTIVNAGSDIVAQVWKAIFG